MDPVTLRVGANPSRRRVQGGFRVIAGNPPGFSCVEMAIAASRAGGIGVLDLSVCSDARLAVRAMDQLAGSGRGDRGVRLAFRAGGPASTLLPVLPPELRWLLVDGFDPETLEAWLPELRRRGVQVWVEVVSAAEADLARRAGADGLVAKGFESGGRVGEETTFVLVQRLLQEDGLPIWARGGIGLHSAGACLVAGASGVCLDWQLALTREAGRLPEAVREAARRADGSETTCLGGELGESYRLYHRQGWPGSDRIGARAAELALEAAAGPAARRSALARWRSEIHRTAGEEAGAWPVGQDLAFAASLAARHATVGGVVQAILAQAVEHVEVAREHQPLAESSPLARSHGTRFPVVQGPMTRVSDRAAFARAVSDGGGLPFLALALLRAAAARELLEETRSAVGDRPWGVGILGFVPLELRKEQLAEIVRCRPTFALIAGGRPDQAAVLEREGIPTYLHVPSPSLLRLFLADGARRFVFEGRECGGHVGPRTSFVLWEQMVDVLLEVVPEVEADRCHVVFAGGIHDARSAAMVAALAAPLARRGIRVGVLMGTAYLFTQEAVASGAIVEGFQREALDCSDTVLLETGPGHSTRCSRGPFAELFQREKQRLLAEGRSAEEIREALERLNLGRLRIAAKGIDRAPADASSDGPRYVAVDGDRQRLEGMYMIGQVAALERRVLTIEDLHREVSVRGSEWLRSAVVPGPVPARRKPSPANVAIVGIGTLLPGAPSLRDFWHNVLAKVDAVGEVPPERWDSTLYYDADLSARDKVASRWGGFLPEVPFDPLFWGLPPATLRSIEPVQLLTLELVRAALQDAGYLDRALPRERTSVLLGAGGGVADLGNAYAVRSALPSLFAEVPGEVLDRLPEWTEDSFAGILLNVAAGRVANRFDLGGVNCTLDAACASSLAAVYMACQELESGSSDVVIAGGIDTVQSPFGFLCFSKTHALSPGGRCRTFDAAADGIAISEGLVALVLKRVDDAERDGDRIYAVIQGVAASSDGRAKGLTAPRPEGQARALRRAYEKAGFSPATVGLVEAHGTGTVAGDRAEVETLTGVFSAAGAQRQACALGSVKSMIGHTKCAAGAAGLAKVALALYHRVLPPTLHVERPGFPVDEGPFYLNTEVRPWIGGGPDRPRRAGVSAFGFGGTNFHVALEEYRHEIPGLERRGVADVWPAELFLFRGSAAALAGEVSRVFEALDRGALPPLAELAWLTCRRAARASEGGSTLAVVASGLDDLRQALAGAREALERGEAVGDGRDVHYSPAPLAGSGRLAFLYPGQGSQYPDMLRELAVHFPVVREAFEEVDRALAGCWDRPLSTRVFPPPAFHPDAAARQREELTRTDVAQPALGAAAAGLHRLLAELGVAPDHVAGHSYGEYPALWAAGALGDGLLPRLSFERGRAIVDAAESGLGGMLAVRCSANEVLALIEGLDGVWLANRNAPRQVILAGSDRGIEVAVARFEEARVPVKRLPVACGFHSPLVAPARDRLAAILAEARLSKPALPVYANATGRAYPDDVDGVRSLLIDHLVNPVRFQDEIETMYDAGARVFVEVGPKRVLTGLVREILADRSHAAFAIDEPGTSGLVGLLRLLGRLAAEGVAVDAASLFRGRGLRCLELERLVEETRERETGSATWLVSGGGVRQRGESAALPAPYRFPEAPSPPAPELPGPAPAGRVGAPAAAAVVTRYQRFLERVAAANEDVLLAYLGSRSSSGAPAVEEAAAPGPVAPIEPVPRFLLERRELPPSGRAPLPAGVCLVVDDGDGVAERLVPELRDAGCRVCLLRDLSTGGAADATVDLNDPATVAAEVARIRTEHGDVRGLIHLGSLAPERIGDPLAPASAAASARTVRTLYLLARELADDLDAAGGVLLAATTLGGGFGLDGGAPAPGQGALAGLVKVLALEWPALRCRTLDLDPTRDPGELAASILGELQTDGTDVEVARLGDARYGVRPRPASLAAAPVSTELDGDSVVLVTGGARGITSVVAQELARRSRSTFVLAGRSAPPPEREAGATEGIEDMAALKRALIAEMTRSGEPVQPAAIESAYRRLLAAREMRATFAALRAAGSRVEYVQLDVRDPEAVEAVVRDVRLRHGRLDGILHGAGLIEDKLVRDKEPESWDRVFGTKVDGALALARAVEACGGVEALRCFVLFASVAGTFGNRGQSDYAAANEVLCRLAAALDRRWETTRVVAVAWGPWAQTGMVSAEVQGRFAARGVQLIVPAAGAHALADELAHGRKGESIVVLGRGPWDQASAAGGGPLLRGRSARHQGGRLEVIHELDPAQHLFLADHLLDGRPVLPAAVAMELMAETASLGWPDLEVSGLRDFRVQKGVPVDGRTATVRLTARAPEHAQADGPLLVTVEVHSLDGGDRAAYRGVVELDARLPEPPPFEPPGWALEPCPLDVSEIYRRYLFHGPLFAAVTAVRGVGGPGVVAELRPSAPAECLAGGGGRWLVDPIVVDGSFQLAILWSRLQHDLTPLPSRFERYHRFGPLEGEIVECHLEARATNGGHTLLTRHCFVSPDGRLLGLLEGMESTCSAALNRLADGPVSLRKAS